MEKLHTVDVAALRPGTLVGSWRVVSRRGQGSYGVVYRAEPVGARGGKPGALKVALHAGDERFEREVELLSRIRHPNVPRLLESGTRAGDGARPRGADGFRLGVVERTNAWINQQRRMPTPRWLQAGRGAAAQAAAGEALGPFHAHPALRRKWSACTPDLNRCVDRSSRCRALDRP